MTALLRFEWRRMRSLAANRAALAAVVGFALLADLVVVGKPLDTEGAALQVVQRDLAVRWLLAAAIGAQGLSAACRIVIDTDRTDVPVMGL
jgi:hypothetical protein